MLIFREFFNTQFDQNILQNAPNCTTFSKFSQGSLHMPLNSQHNDNYNDNELFIQTKSSEKHHRGIINNTYKYTNITTFVPRRLH